MKYTKINTNMLQRITNLYDKNINFFTHIPSQVSEIELRTFFSHYDESYFIEHNNSDNGLLTIIPFNSMHIRFKLGIISSSVIDHKLVIKSAINEVLRSYPSAKKIETEIYDYESICIDDFLICGMEVEHTQSNDRFKHGNFWHKTVLKVKQEIIQQGGHNENTD